MGGYGALKAALTYPQNYKFCASLSGSLDITRKNRPYDLEEWRSIFGFDLKSADELEGTTHDLFKLADDVNDPPYVYMWCGTVFRQSFRKKILRIVSKPLKATIRGNIGIFI